MEKKKNISDSFCQDIQSEIIHTSSDPYDKEYNLIDNIDIN